MRSSPGCCCSASVAPCCASVSTPLVSVVLLGLSVLTDAVQGLWPDNYQTVQIFEEGSSFRDCRLAQFLRHYAVLTVLPCCIDPRVIVPMTPWPAWLRPGLLLPVLASNALC